MKKFIYSFFSELKRNKIFSIIIIIQILAFILVVGAFIQDKELSEERLSAYNPEYKDAIALSVKNLDDYLGKPGFENIAHTQTLTVSEKFITIANSLAIDMFRVPHSGSWFSKTVSPDYTEAIVSKKLEKEFKIGETYYLEDPDDFFASNDYTKPIKVIGYLGANDFCPSFQLLNYEKLFAPSDILLHDNLPPKSNKFILSTIFTVGYDEQFYLENYDLNAWTFGKIKDMYQSNTFPVRYYLIMMLSLVFSMIFIGIFCNSIFRTEENIRRNCIKFIVGEKPKKIFLSEILKSTVLFVIPFLINIFIVLFEGINARNKLTQPFISWRGFAIASLIIAGVYILSISAGLVRTLSAKPLKELKKQL